MILLPHFTLLYIFNILFYHLTFKIFNLQPAINNTNTFSKHKIVGRRTITKQRAELPDLCMLCCEELYEPDIHPLTRLKEMILDFTEWTNPNYESNASRKRR